MSQSINITNNDLVQQIKILGHIPDIIQQIITRTIIEKSAAELGIKIETEELQKAADQMRLMNNLLNAEETWKWLEKNHLSLDDFEHIVYINLLSSKLSAHLFTNQAEPYFYERQLDYQGAVMYEVMLDDEDLAWELFYAIKEDETSFFDVAHKYIQDVELRRKCGYIGLVHRQDLSVEVSTAVFAAKPPQLLKPIVTAKGVHLIFVEEIVQRQLDEKLRQEISAQLYYEWLKTQSEQVELTLQLD
ncbi:peptidylprolyl isomerase [Nostoc sp. UHCC 0870]|uniref:peptidylprolyl isomerase n=1 Tax=Nostoc sp. UHCC 0870 TaxID=2914041 RepID=UPI001EE0344A|nr:peptidylprolyl isomerase [Nostoc sp. UHCC 0870]UKO97982.1 peptidylprolyl isomerase [Nostoc sp. UHCC 0870]